MLEPIFRFDRPGGARYVNAAISAGQAGQLAGLLREREGRRLAVQLERATRVPANPIVRLAAAESRLLLDALDELARTFGLGGNLEQLRRAVAAEVALHSR